MSGFITVNEVRANRAFIVESYGFAFYVACLFARNTTFLAMLVRHGKI